VKQTLEYCIIDAHTAEHRSFPSARRQEKAEDMVYEEIWLNEHERAVVIGDETGVKTYSIDVFLECPRIPSDDVIETCINASECLAYAHLGIFNGYRVIGVFYHSRMDNVIQLISLRFSSKESLGAASLSEMRSEVVRILEQKGCID
jgi:hypothetical protein